MALLGLLAEIVFEIIGDTVGDYLLHNFGRGKQTQNIQILKQVCRKCRQRGSLTQKNKDWYLYECQACQTKWTAHRRKTSDHRAAAAILGKGNCYA